jgi:hypothetical protein
MRSLFGFTKEQAHVILGAGSLSSGELKKLSDMFRGRMSHSRSYTSTSANPNLNVFKGKPIERRITVPKGTHAYAVSGNPHESEVIFGRGVQTELVGISVSSSGHIVLHERFVGYKKK